jgi:hypothetical protein
VIDPFGVYMTTIPVASRSEEGAIAPSKKVWRKYNKQKHDMIQHL